MDWPSHTQNRFRGVNEFDDLLIGNEEASACKNVLLDKRGSLRSRLGRARRNTNAITSTPNVLDLHRFYLSGGTKKFLAGTGAALWLGAETGDKDFTSLKSGLTAGAKGRYQTFKDKCFRVNGNNTNLKYDGSNVLNMGVETPAAPAVAKGDSNGLTGNYYYKCTYLVDGYSEGNASVASDLIDPSGEAVVVTKPTSTPEADVTKWIIYRTIAGGSIYYKLAEVAIGTGTYTDTTADSSLDTGTTAPSDYSAPPANADFICLLHRYIFLADKDTSRVYFSTQDYPEKYPAAYYFDINPKDGENLSGLITALGYIYCFKQNAIYAICGNDVTDFGVPPNKWSKYGCYAPDTLVEGLWQGIPVIFYLHKTGLRIWNGTNSHLVSSKIQDTIDSILDDYIDIACAEIVGEELWLSICTSGTTNNETWILDLETGDWRKNDFGCNALMAEKAGDLYSAQNSGWVNQERTGNADLGGNIAWEYETKNFSFPHDDGDQNKYRQFEIWASLATDTLGVTFTVDNNDTGNKSWYKDLAALGATLVKTEISLPKNLIGELIKVKYSSTGQNQAEIRKTILRMIPIPRRL